MDEKQFLLDMNNQKDSWYYELSILVCSESENKPILDYTNFVWSLKNIEGPYDKNGNKIRVDANLDLTGIIHTKDFLIPFKTMNIKEEHAGTNWFDICFYEHSLKHVLGTEYSAYANITTHPKILVDFFEDLLPELYIIFNFNIAIVGIEVGGMYDLESFEDNCERVDDYFINNALFYVGKNEYNKIAEKNKKYFKIIN